MDAILHYFSTHPLAIMALVFIILLFVYFIFKQLIKIALLFVIIILALAGYFYFTSPGHVWENLKATLQKTEKKAGDVVEKGKEAYKAGHNLYEKGKALPGDVKKLLDKNEEASDPDAGTEKRGVIEKGKEVYQKAYREGKNLYEKGKVVPGKVKKMLDKDEEAPDGK